MRTPIQWATDWMRSTRDPSGIWFVVAKVEGSDSAYPVESRFSAADLSEVAASYNTSFRRAPVVSYEGGNPHLFGEENPAVGFVEELSFDGDGLWARVSQVITPEGEGRIEQEVARGFSERSVWLWDTPETGGLYLRHLALTTQPGIPNMPNLDHYYLRTVGEQEPALAHARCVVSALGSGGYAMRCTCNGNHDQSNQNCELQMGMRTPQNPAQQNANPAQNPAQHNANPAQNPAQQNANPAFPQNPSNHDPSQMDALTRSVQSMSEMFGQGMGAMNTALTYFAQQAQQNSATQRRALVNERLERYVREFRVAPFQVEGYATHLCSPGLSDEAVTQFLDGVGQQPAVYRNLEALGVPSVVQTTGADGGTEWQNVSRRYTLPTGQRVDHAEYALVMRAREESGGDFSKFRSLVYAANGQRDLSTEVGSVWQNPQQQSQ